MSREQNRKLWLREEKTGLEIQIREPAKSLLKVNLALKGVPISPPSLDLLKQTFSRITQWALIA